VTLIQGTREISVIGSMLILSASLDVTLIRDAHLERPVIEAPQ
jgi:hypothetical protein